MPDDWAVLTAAFDRECNALLDVLRAIDDSDFGRVTNCPPWTLRELVVHIAYSACATPARLPPPADSAARVTAADYYRRAERATEGYRTGNVERTQQVARRYPSGHDATDAISAAWAQTRLRLEALDPATTMAGRANVIRGDTVLAQTEMLVTDFFITRVIALAAHAADVAITLEREPWTTEEALIVVTPTLAELFGEPDPRTVLGCGRLSFLLVATGRRPLTANERDRLGERSKQFPLLA